MDTQRPYQRVRRRRLALLIGSLMAALVGIMPAATAGAQQATWIKTTNGGAACASQAGYVSYNRVVSSTCYTNRAFGADSNLRTSGYDTYNDGYFVGNQHGATRNTDSIYNRWSITIRICLAANFVGASYTLGSGQSIGFGANQGIMSHRGSACV